MLRAVDKHFSVVKRRFGRFWLALFRLWF